MRMKYLAATAAALLLSAAPLASAARELIVYHGWSSKAEVAALHVLQDALTAKGHSWKDLAIPHNSGVNVSLVNLVTGGEPPNAFVNSDPGVYRDLQGLGLARDLTDYYKQIGATDNFFPIIRELSTVDGKMVKVPLFMHIDGMVYWNMEVAKKAGVDPTAWKSVDEMIADFPKVKEAGFVAAAVGGQAFQVGYLFHAMLAATAGPDIYNRMYGAEVDPTVFDTPEVKKAIEIVRVFSEQATPESENRPWNETTNTVIAGQALFHIMGDWMKGEWLAAGKKPGVDFGCEVIPGTKAVSVTSDAMGVLGGQDAEIDKAELDLVAAFVDPVVSAKANQQKGSTSPRADASTEFQDDCNKVAMAALNVPNGQVANPFNITNSDWHNAIWTVMYNFWSDKNLTTDDAVQALKDNYDQVFG
ncbi:MAG: carbohydrate ABC transporter substrate-binding protein [Devosia nanyangense]|uniref:Carbohydrate ABC transporter substrate-binding protein n=1 Tax=Devosia nanyangense TaxID=1228055 RepID=A0A933L274_9HYPH|nr:carbohydrate ABC transporter substrate-binding protein [Devosia nanyangense]